MKIQFNDEATTMFEYPSEASLMEDQSNVKPESETSTCPRTPGLPIALRCGNLASYTPSKVPLSTDFQLGITKTIAPPPPKSASQEVANEAEDEVEEESCLRPADESSTVQWSSETAADLLF
ncbi:hypothetical protein RUM43_013920 [Polyplax serrata]|uniref:Uncharacterized protein n=1 Tax=Polyplax serrata TaxID=468196 RepID=A0AAN8P1P0_POLSC